MYHHVPESLKEQISLEGLSEGKKLNKKIINNLNKYIKDNLLNKTYEDHFIFDASFHVIVDFEGKKVTINNYPEINSEINKLLRGGK